jgi:hypothetical protein
MLTPKSDRPIAVTPARRSRLAAAMPLLQEAFDDAHALNDDVWQFAVTVKELFKVGLTGPDLRWLIAHGVVGHAVERLRGSDGPRSFRSLPDLCLVARSCFVLTDEGARVLALWFPTTLFIESPMASNPDSSSRPSWNGRSRELTWQGQLVKRFRVVAPNQQLILEAFEEDGWPTRIDDPLDGRCDDPRQRLHDAVRNLNRHQRGPQVRFRRDGSGEGVCWEGG